MQSKFLVVLLFPLVPISPTYAQNRTIEKVILEERSLSINGTSNVNDFECNYNSPPAADTLEYAVEFKESEIHVEGDELNMYVESFDCGKKGINRDFRKTLRSEEYPTINVTLERLIHENGRPVIAEVLITLAGVSRIYQVDISNQTLNNDVREIYGKQVIRLSDFNLEPPRALFGLVKVRDEMDINFTLSVKQ